MTVIDLSGNGTVPAVGDIPPPGYSNEFADKMAEAINASDPELSAALAAYSGGASGATTVSNITDATSAAKAFLLAVNAAARQVAAGFGTAALEDAEVFAQTIHVHSADQITEGVFDPARLPPSSAITNVVPAGGAIASLTAPEQALITQGCFVTEADGQIYAYKGSGSKTAEASYVLTGATQLDWVNVLNKPSTFAPSAHATSHNSGGADPLTLSNLAGILSPAKGGTGQANESDAINALVPDQAGNADKVLGTNGSVVSWVTQTGGSGGSSTPNYKAQGAAVSTAVTTSEAVIGSATTALTGSSSSAVIRVFGYLSIQKGTGTTAITWTVRIRRGTTTAGTLVATATGTSAAANDAVPIPISGFDTLGASSGQYVITVQGSAANGTVLRYIIDAFEIGGGGGAVNDASIITAAETITPADGDALIAIQGATVGSFAARLLKSKWLGGITSETAISLLQALFARGGVPVAHWGVVADGTTDDTTALQAAVSYAITNHIRVSLGLGVHNITASIKIGIGNIDAYGFGIVGQGYGSCIKQLTANTPCIEYTGTSAALHTNTLSSFRMTHNALPADADVLSCGIYCAVSAVPYNCRWTDLWFDNLRRAYGCFTASGTSGFWGCNVSDWQIDGCKGGIWLVPSSGGNPNNHFRNIYIKAELAIETLFNTLGCGQTRISTYEVNNNSNGQMVLDGVNSQYLFDVIRCEVGTYAGAADKILVRSSGGDLIGQMIHLSGSTVNLTGGANLYLCSSGITANGVLDVNMLHVGGITYTSGGIKGVYGNDGYWVHARIGAFYGLDSNCKLLYNGGSTSVYQVKFDQTAGGYALRTDANLTLTNLDVEHNEFPQLTANRVVTLPARFDDNAHQNREFLFRRPAATAGAFTLALTPSGGSTVATLPASTRAWCRVRFNRQNANGWDVIGYGTLP